VWPAMALPGRTARRPRAGSGGSAGFRWLAVAVAVTILVLLVDAALKSRDPKPVEDLAAGAWVDRVLPVIASSTAEGQALAGVWSSGLAAKPAALAAEVDRLASEASSDYQAVVSLRPPQQLGGSAGLLEACLLARSQAAADVRDAVLSAVGASAQVPTPHLSSPATALVSQAGQDIQVGDQAYRLFQSTFPASVGVKMPPSAWAPNMAPYQPQAAQTFLASLQSHASATPLHRVQIYAVSFSPSPVSLHGSTIVLPDATAVTVTIVMANTGNQVEDNLTVVASINPAGQGASSARDFVNLQPGQAYTISGLGPLDPPQGPPVTLTVTITSPGSPTPLVTSATVFQMPAPPPSTTTPPTT
jgi:hypothetical protein